MNNDRALTESRRRQYFNKIDRFTLLLVTISGMGSVLLLARMATYGIYLTWDSVLLYLPAARNLLDGDGFTIWTGGPYANSAPLYPLIWAFFSSFGLDIIQTAEYLHAALFGLTIFVIAMWLRTRIESRFLIVWAACSCTVSLSLIEFSARAGTEIMFTLFVCCSLFSMDRFLNTQRRSLLIWAALAAGGALLTRYVGVTLIGSGILILLTQRNVSLREKLSNAGTYFLVAVALFGVWILRNMLVIGSLLGRLPPDEFSLLRSLHIATGEISIWIFGVTGLEFLDGQVRRLIGFSINGSATVSAIVLKVAILAYIVIGIGFALSRYRPGTYRRNRECFRCIFGFVLVYSGFYMVYLPVSDVLLPIRFLIPLFPILFVSATIALDRFISKPQSIEFSGSFRSRARTKFVSIFLSLIVCLWTLSWIIPSYDHIKSWNDHGRGYGSKRWGQSEIVEYLNTNPRDEVIWSNDHAALYHLISNSDDKQIYRLPLDLAEAKVSIFDNLSAGIETRIIWFEWNWSGSLKDLGTSLEMEVEAILKDGVILKEWDKFAERATDTTPVNWDKTLLDALLSDVTLIADSNFSVYLDNRYNRLIYVKDSCGMVDIVDQVILQVFPLNNLDLSIHREQYGFDDFRFYLTDHFISIDYNHCIAIRSLPAYDISAIRTGRIQRGSVIWEGEYTFVP